MPRHNQERSRAVYRASIEERERVEATSRRSNRSRHWGHADYRQRSLDDVEVLSVRNVEELQDFVGRY